ncbi:MAG: sigma-54-dependent Fis family transcriptional regulator [Kofleriaceae bacterium]|nr:sigma-54-dependent Fis family transcriptional regulator [Kofleriaceae bacterium]MCL4225376.1 sigma-54 dependent transcriptional regulator [Myxococcales bacterium]
MTPAPAQPATQVLVVDAEPHIPRLVALLLGDGHVVDAAADAARALERLQAVPYDVVLVDLELPGGGAALVERLHAAAPDLAVVALAAAPTLQSAVAAMRHGAFDVLRKTVSGDELRAAIERAMRHGALAREVRRLRGEVDRARGLGEIVGESAPMRQLLALVERVAATDATVLILGESGTGKELLARTLHRLGPRAERPFVAFDCSALTPSLLEAELFGHEKGAFTGAGRARRGLFREAHEGTIFLDEIGDIAPSVQNKLLRVLQEREIKPVGADHVVSIDVRVVAATNKDLKALVAAGHFREDLYWRLAVVPIQVPPLRERREDIPLLAGHILARRRGAAKTAPGATGAARYPTTLTHDALARLLAYHWPGNIRELENVLSRAAILCDGEKIRAQDLDLAGLAPSPARATRDARDAATVDLRGLGDHRTLKDVVDHAVRTVEKAALTQALDEAAGSPARAARLLGISRASIYNKMKEYGLTGGDR